MKEDKRKDRKMVKRKCERLYRTARLYLDHDLRVRDAIEKDKQAEEAQKEELRKRLEEHRKALDHESSKPTSGIIATSPLLSIQVQYGDIVERLVDVDWSMGRIGAIVTSIDTCLSAGGGVALRILEEAGEYVVLNELDKYESELPVGRGRLIVTSGGNLPVQFIIFAALSEISNYKVKKEDVTKTVSQVIELSRSLNVANMWLPLLGSGTGQLSPEESLSAILCALRDASLNNQEHEITVVVVVASKDEEKLPLHEAKELLEKDLHTGDWKFELEFASQGDSSDVESPTG